MPFYLLHMTFTVLAGIFIIRFDLQVAVKYPLIVVLSTILTGAACELARRSNLARWFFGMKPVKQTNSLPTGNSVS